MHHSAHRMKEGISEFFRCMAGQIGLRSEVEQ